MVKVSWEVCGTGWRTEKLESAGSQMLSQAGEPTCAEAWTPLMGLEREGVQK